ncbi:hypothetical protein [Acinetobacter sp. 10FS3-1]|uniref:hypothetical protein n=1 Tax=Acinetobacter sp. 10FS3-1 TaxID=2563897 RepID=UPI00157DE42F|nr:hypothetical protein [Acinetobacter sp. 10FS3-1]QKQ70433.1 hypothetical protein E5Y90_09455 [Acinetobacter sp. 10FS3-1]
MPSISQFADKDITGFREINRTHNSASLFAILEDGCYRQGEADSSDDLGHSGIDIRQLAWNTTTIQFTAHLSPDTHGGLELSHPVNS